ncbi:MAG TPA: choice-of-anchor Q domain-containing protein, partial [Gaiellaceae bacterium]|nr:choice-of-anchor Q domain-containing protein [Gaiellaceae bacterium]
MGALITKSGQTQILAGMTRLVISGQDSFQSASNDGWTKIRRWVWTWSDGLVQYGACFSRKFTVAGTYTLTLVTEFKDGTTSSAQTTITVSPTPSFSAFTKYVSSTTGNDTFDGNSPAFPYKTLQKVVDVWTTFRSGSSTGFAWGQVLLKSGDSFPFAEAAGFDFGPLYVSTYGGTARATIAFTSALDGVGFTLCRGGHDNLYDNPIFWKGVNLTFNANHRTSDDQETIVSFSHVATQLEDSIVTNAEILMSINGGATPHGGTLYNCECANSYRNGVFFSAQFAGIEQCNIHDAGHIDSRDNEIYASAGCAHSYVSNTTLSQLVNPTTSGGLNGSGINKLYISDLTVNGCRTAFGPGGNEAPPGEVTQDVVCDRLTGIDIDGVGIYPNYLNRVSIRNPRLFRCIGPVIRFQSYNSGQKIDSFEVLDASFSLCTDGISAESDGDQSDGLSTNVVIENMALTMPSAGTGIVDHIFFMLKSAASINGFTLKNCQYYRVGDTASSTTFAMVGGYAGGAAISFTDWQTNISHEPGSKYGDPLFNDPNTDLHLQTASPCIDAGFDTGVGFDFDGIARPQGASYDIGAYESTISSGGKYTFRQQAQTFQVGTTEIGFESQAAADAGVRQAIADNPICGLNGLAWVYPGTNN